MTRISVKNTNPKIPTTYILLGIFGILIFSSSSGKSKTTINGKEQKEKEKTT